MNVPFVKKGDYKFGKTLHENFRIMHLQVDHYAANDSSIIVFVTQDILKYMKKSNKIRRMKEIKEALALM